MRSVKYFLLGLCAMACVHGMAETKPTKFQGEEYIYALLLTSDIDQSIKAAAKSLYNTNSTNTQLLDVAANVLHSNFEDPQLRVSRADTIAWLAKTLAQSRNRRYFPTVQMLIDSTDPGGKIGRHALVAIEYFSGDPAEPFLYENDAYSKLANDLNSLSTDFRDLGSEYFDLNIGDTLDTVLTRVGRPNSVSIGHSTAINLPFGSRIRTTGLELAYYGYGVIYLNYQKTENVGWVINIVSNAYKLTNESNSQKDKDMVEQLLSPDWLSIQDTVRSGRSQNFGKIVYDVAMERLMRTRKTRADYEETMLAHLARFIASSRDPRYQEALEEVYRTAPSRTVKRHTKKAYRYLKKIDPYDGMKNYSYGDIEIGKITNAQFGLIGISPAG